jgi:hypothetical protein
VSKISLKLFTIQANASNIVQGDTRFEFEAGRGAFIGFCDFCIGDAVTVFDNVDIIAAGSSPPIHVRSLTIVPERSIEVL